MTDRDEKKGDPGVAEQDDELGHVENELLPSGEALHDANQDIDPDDQDDEVSSGNTRL